MVTTGQSLPKARRPPPSSTAFQAKARCSRSGPAFLIQLPIQPGSGLAWRGWKLPMTPSRPKRGDVGGGDVLGVLDLVADVRVPGGPLALFVGVEAQADGRVADGVGRDLQAPGVEGGHGLLVVLRLPEELALVPLLALVGIEHGAGAGVDDAVEHELDPVDGQIHSSWYFARASS